MGDNIITWNVRNWVTVFLMFFAGWAVFALLIRAAKAATGAGSGKTADA